MHRTTNNYNSINTKQRDIDRSWINPPYINDTYEKGVREFI